MYKKITELLFRRDAYVYSNFCLKMKLTVLLLAVTFFQIKAETYAQKISVTTRNASFSEVIAQIRKQTDYDFLYNNQTLKDAKPITLDVHDLDVRRVLDLCFKEQPLTYTIKNKTVLIVKKTNEKPFWMDNEQK
ncbi:SusC/RagA family TonB-linked outer membrane protein, partial [Pedobacter sp. HMWF019]|uniref:STN domain-containing protein n=1 Tax=Pedobacter sp. HMWF019 TaxID=2056856 RepID=UPI000D442143